MKLVKDYMKQLPVSITCSSKRIITYRIPVNFILFHKL